MNKAKCACLLLLLVVSSVCHPNDIDIGIEAYEKRNYDLAISSLSKVIVANPKASSAYFYRALAYREKKEFGNAIDDLSEVIRLDEKPAFAYYNRALVHSLKKDFDTAIKDFDEAARLEPKNALPYVGRGYTYMDKKEFEKAESDYLAAIRLDPKLSAGYNNLAWLRATCPIAKIRDGKEAVRLATKACELSNWKSWFELNSLAAAYAEIGDFKQAIQWQKKALEIGIADDELLSNAKKRLKQFEDNKPHRYE